MSFLNTYKFGASLLRPNHAEYDFRYVLDIKRKSSMQNANNPYFFNKHNQINFKLSSVGFSNVKKATLFTILKKWLHIDRLENGRKMVNRGRREEIGKSGDSRFNMVWSDYRRISK